MSVWHLAEGITCHAWNHDRSKVAICPNTNEIWIYSNCHAPDVAQWRKEAILTEHDMLVSGLDWSPVHNMIVSCSHDRSAFVWNYEPAERKWKPSLVVLRITRAAINVKWSPDGKKFAVGSSAKCVSVCYYQALDNWWISKMIKKHKSTVVDLDWHPNSQLLATASTDMKCRVFAAYIAEVDEAPNAGPFADMAPFGEPMAEFDNANAWVNAVAWSNAGNRLAFAGHGSSIHFVHFGHPGEVPTIQSIRFPQLPLTRLQFLSNEAIVGCGYDFNVLLFTMDPNGYWSFSEHFDKKTSSSTNKTTTGFNSSRAITTQLYKTFSLVRERWESKVTRGQSAAATSSDKGALWTKHEATITCIQPYNRSSNGNIVELTTSVLFVWLLEGGSSTLLYFSLRRLMSTAFATYGVFSLCFLGFIIIFYASYYLCQKYVPVFQLYHEVERGEWCSRINSTIHSTVICTGLLYSFTQQEWNANMFPIHSMELATSLFSFSIAYFAFDLYVVYAWKIEHWKVFVAHHIIAMIPYIIFNFYGGCVMNAYLLSMYLLVEICIPPMNLATILDLLGYKDTLSYVVLFYVAYIAWFFSRVCLPMYTVYVMWVDFIPIADLSSFHSFFCAVPAIVCGHIISIFCIGCFIFMITPDVLARWQTPKNSIHYPHATNYGTLEAV
ncbi:actin-related protein 2/3 complex subunit [Thraustotheca clavata]|uniref:Arp2/3 complex 41 kDa subunit n=1 Tax=Thraustotheca clavata TaxID=74557 RepID=A0A1V9Z0K3_9STRA|nr:actin-related protein 2/3 complex subunit [Thraustotheca clavata]